MANQKIRVGISGTGFIAKGLTALLRSSHPDFVITVVLTRRPLSPPPDFVAPALLTSDPDFMAANCDLVVECSGTVGGAARVALATTSAGVPLVTLNAEFQVTLGSYFASSGLVREARGDQPGSIAALDAEARAMGFEPLVYASQKGFINTNPTADEMQYWAKRQGISVASTVSFTDGTKVHIEQALVANGLGATISDEGILGPKVATLAEGGETLAKAALQIGQPISDYVLQAGGRGEVFVVAHHSAPPKQLAYYKLGDGPFYLLQRPFHLGHLEVPLTLLEVVAGRAPDLTGGHRPKISVAAFAKQAIPAGQDIPRAIGSFDFYGRAVHSAHEPSHVPIGLLESCRLKNQLQPGQMVRWDDIIFTDEVAMTIARTIYSGAPS